MKYERGERDAGARTKKREDNAEAKSLSAVSSILCQKIGYENKNRLVSSPLCFPYFLLELLENLVFN